MDILKWRNEQIYHLRQEKLLTEIDQENYFKNVVNKSFQKDKPSQLLFSYLEGETCIGYGGLVHINWTDRNAEVSFIMNTELENEYFSMHWQVFLDLIEQVAFKDLKLFKIFTYAFDVRPKLYKVLEEEDWLKEAVLKRHFCLNGNFKDIIIHSKFRIEL
jgi:RimJ/RimL family protein N-acetyltransferase